jgi:transcription elongation factor GreA
MEFLTRQEKEDLEARLASLWQLREQLVQRIAEARSKGDLRENADYHAAREDHAFNESEIKRLDEKLKRSKVTDESVVPEGMVFVGATVRLRDISTGDEDLYRLVGEARVDFTLDYIEVSSNSPMGQSLMKARVGDTIRVDLPRGEKQYEIVAIV